MGHSIIKTMKPRKGHWKFYHGVSNRKITLILNKSGRSLKTGLMAKENTTVLIVFQSYAMRLLRRIRNVLTPKGRSNNAPAIIVVASGTGVRETLSRMAP